jgi:hypothetical protein
MNAISAPYAGLAINQDDSIFCPLEDRVILIRGIIDIRDRAGSHAGWMFTMVTGTGDEEQAGHGIHPSLFLYNPSVAHMIRKNPISIFELQG